MKNLLIRYRVFLILLFINLTILIIYPAIGRESFRITRNNLVEMLSVIPPIFVLLGLLDVWVQREMMIKLMVLMKKGSKFSNILIFIGAWSTTKIPLLLFEASALGWKFMLTRFIVDIPVIALIAYITEKLLSEKEKRLIYENAAKME